MSRLSKRIIGACCTQICKVRKLNHCWNLEWLIVGLVGEVNTDKVIWTWKKFFSKCNQAYKRRLYPLDLTAVEVTTHMMRQGIVGLDPGMVVPAFGQAARPESLKAMWRCIRRGQRPETWHTIDPRDVEIILCGSAPMIAAPSIPTLDFYWYGGSTGTGKSRSAREGNPGYYLKEATNRWWDGYQDHSCVIIEEFSPDVDKYLKQKIKEWCDHHCFSAEVKGGTICIRPERIIITSNYSMTECFEEKDQDGNQIAHGLLEPLLRRIKVINFGTNGPDVDLPRPVRKSAYVNDRYDTPGDLEDQAEALRNQADDSDGVNTQMHFQALTYRPAPEAAPMNLMRWSHNTGVARMPGGELALLLLQLRICVD
jgi:hypothetical protein